MNRPRLAPLLLRAWLVISLAVVPFVPAASVHAAGMGVVSVVAGTMMDHSQHMAAGDQADHCQVPAGDSQNGDCNGPCCASCAHCSVMSALSPGSDAPQRAVLTPRESKLFPFAYLPLRERPPRVFSV